ncbi:AAR2 protein-domain-containing protein [Tricladium varicosporioides]|nr:AAR2 protein-domain-containing protein [Hymenoscyphus varicosporioides]
MDSDEQFQATPINRAGNAIPANGSDNHVNEDPTFMQNQIAIQRSPSTTKGQASALSHQLSIKSHGSRDFGAVRSGIANVLSEEGDFKQGRSDSESSIVHTTNKCSLSKSSSERSAKSVRSVHAVGSYPLGSLRLHSPSPTRPTSNAIKHECLKSGDVFIARDVPAGAIVGCDTIAFTIKPTDRFDGIREIPAGIHFIWGGSTVTSLRNGFWVISSERNPSDFGAIHVRRWDRENEILEEEVSRAEIRIQKEGLPEIFFNLRPYIKPGHGSISPSKGQSAISIRDTDIWSKLTSCISGALLSQITGCKEWNQWHVCSSNDNEQQITLSRDPKIMIDHYKDEPLNFMFPRHMRTFSEESLGSLRTEQALDSTSHVLASISSNCMNEDPDEILGEIQFCYITGMMLGNVACMEQWAHIIKTMFRAFQLVLVRPVFFRKFIESVHSQLIYDEEGVEGSILDHDPTLGDDLRLILTTFKSRLNEMLLEKGNDINESQTAVGKAFEEFESWLWRWEWDLRGNYVRSGRIQLEDGQWVDAELKDFEAEDERGEFAPVMVELDDDGREKGLICF